MVGETSEYFFLKKKEIKQGCCLSPNLSIIKFRASLKHRIKKYSSIGIHLENNQMHTIFFADDHIVIIIAKDREGIEYMLNKLTEECNKWGFGVNTEKTQNIYFYE